MFDVGSMDLEQDYFYKGFVQDLCRETRPEMDFDDCQRSVIFGFSSNPVKMRKDLTRRKS